VCYACNTSQFGPATFQVLNIHVWLFSSRKPTSSYGTVLSTCSHWSSLAQPLHRVFVSFILILHKGFDKFFPPFFFWWIWTVWTQGFTLAGQMLYHLSHTCSPFCMVIFGDGVLWTIYPGWSQTTILEISASQVARITGMSHQAPGSHFLIIIISWELLLLDFFN
jgi:hypothetical protein